MTTKQLNTTLAKLFRNAGLPVPAAKTTDNAEWEAGKEDCAPNGENYSLDEYLSDVLED